MNYLAHAFLSFDDPELLVGNMISDFVKGKQKFGYPSGIQEGIALHRAIEPVIQQVDHKFLNQVPGLENPTCEYIAIWLWNQLKPVLPLLSKIELYETPTSGVVYEGR